MQAPVARSYSIAELSSLRTGYTRQCTLGQVPTDLLTRRYKNSVRSLGLWKPTRNNEFRWIYNPTMALRYDHRIPNRRWKYLFFKRGGKLDEFRKIRPFDAVRIAGEPILEWRGSKYRVIGNTGDIVKMSPPGRRRKALGRPSQADLADSTRRLKVETNLGPVYVPPHKRDWFARLDFQRAKERTITERAKVSSDGNINVLGGRILPLREHSKYWYFLRKRGYFVFSEHHPYGDEALCFPDPHRGLVL